MAFWGIEVTGDKPKAFVPPPEAARLHISQATLGIDAAIGERIGLSCKIAEDTVLICSLREGGQESCTLDLIVDSYAEFSLVGKKGSKPKGSIHLAGYVMPEEEEEESDGEYGMNALEDLDPEELENLTDDEIKALMTARQQYGILGSDDEDSEDESEDEYDSQGEDDSDEDEEPKSSVIIEELHDDGPEPKTMTTITEIKATPGKIEEKTLKIQGKAAASDIAMPDALEDGSEEEGSDDIEEADGEDSDSEEEEEQLEAEIAANGKKRKAAAEKQIAAEIAASKQAEPAKKKQKQKAEQVKTPVAKAKQTDSQATPSTLKASAAKQTASKETTQGAATPLKGVKKYENGFVVENVTMGDPNGKLAKGGKKVVVKYVGKLAKTGKVFDQTKGKSTFAFRLGVGEVIKGWDQGVVGMRVGDKRKLTVPPQMAYGTKGVGSTIPGNSTLIFDVELVDVKG